MKIFISCQCISLYLVTNVLIFEQIRIKGSLVQSLVEIGYGELDANKYVIILSKWLVEKTFQKLNMIGPLLEMSNRLSIITILNLY